MLKICLKERKKRLIIRQYKIHANIFMQIKLYTQMRDNLYFMNREVVTPSLQIYQLDQLWVGKLDEDEEVLKFIEVRHMF